MYFKIKIDPPTVTAQEKGVDNRGEKVKFYTKPKVKMAKELFMRHLMQHVPLDRMQGPIFLKTVWIYRPNKSHKAGEYKTTKPDTDNALKLFKDCMTKVGFWKDDSQVCFETTVKMWGNEPGIEVTVCEIDTKADD